MVCCAIFVLVAFLAGMIVGQGAEFAETWTWNPWVYYQQLTNVMASPWSSEEIWYAAREQRGLLLWSAGTTVVSLCSLYSGGVNAALNAIQRMTAFRQLMTRGHTWAPAGLARRLDRQVLQPTYAPYQAARPRSLDGSGDYWGEPQYTIDPWQQHYLSLQDAQGRAGVIARY